MPTVTKVPPPVVLDPTPQKFTREEAIQRLLAQGLTLADIQAEEEQVAPRRAIALLRARYWMPAPAAPASAPAVTPPPALPSTPAPPPATLRYRVRNLNAVFSLPLRQTPGFAQSVLQLVELLRAEPMVLRFQHCHHNPEKRLQARAVFDLGKPQMDACCLTASAQS